LVWMTVCILDQSCRPSAEPNPARVKGTKKPPSGKESGAT
jgi:hypothetical protein